MNRMSPDIRGMYILGATGTKYTSRPITDAMNNAYPKGAHVINSSFLSPNPPPDSELVGLLKAHSGHPVDIYVHSAGGAQFRRAWEQTRGEVDMSNMTVISIDIPTGPGNLRRGTRLVGGKERKAIDSVTAFHPDEDIMSLAVATNALREEFMKNKAYGTDLKSIDYRENPVGHTEYSSSLPDEQITELDNLDTQIIASLRGTDRGLTRRLLIARGIMLNGPLESIYRGEHKQLRPSHESKGEIKSQGSPLHSLRESARMLPAVASGRGWQLMGELEQQHVEGKGGPRVMVALPEWAAYTSKRDAVDIYPSAEIAAQHIVFLSGLTHSGIALQPHVISGIRDHIDLIAA